MRNTGRIPCRRPSFGALLRVRNKVFSGTMLMNGPARCQRGSHSAERLVADFPPGRYTASLVPSPDGHVRGVVDRSDGWAGKAGGT